MFYVLSFCLIGISSSFYVFGLRPATDLPAVTRPFQPRPYLPPYHLVHVPATCFFSGILTIYLRSCPIGTGGCQLAKLVRAKNVPLSLFWQSSTPAKPEILARIRYTRGSSSSITFAGSAFASRKLFSPPRCLQDSFLTPGDLKLHDSTASRRKIQQTFRILVTSLLKHKPQVK